VTAAPARRRAFVVAVVGAESCGKTRLVTALAGRLAAAGERAVVVDEHLRAFCDAAGRTPRQGEQAAIAAEQTRRIADAAARPDVDVVLADTTALMTAVYSDLVFGDAGLYAAAEHDHADGCDLTLLAATDLPWQADGLQRDGAHVRDPVDARVRAVLHRAGAPYAVVSGTGEARTDAAWAAVRAARGAGSAPVPATVWACEHCGDSACERRLLTRLVQPPPS